jgi:Flp pilus assembly protein TadG
VTSRLRRDDAGNAIVEFVFLAVLLMVPLVYLLVTVFRVQAGAYAASSAARESGRVFATAASVDVAADRAYAAAAIVMRDSGLTLDRDELRVTCSSDPCLEPGSRVTVVVTQRVGLPLVPRVLGRAPASVRVSSEHVEVVDRYRAVHR